MVEKHNGKHTLKSGSGGLVTALLPVLRDRGGTWIGWSGTHTDSPELAELFREASREAGYELVPITLTEDEVDKYYHGYSNEVLWPLFHDLQSRCDFVPEYWHVYSKVNHKFAEALNSRAEKDDFI
jgi:trehalose-6-phosphate synthase